MANTQAFGRRASPQAASVAPIQIASPSIHAPIDSEAMALPKFNDAMSVDDELAEWRRARRFPIPWRQLWLMASLSFGIASLVLPDSINDIVQWLLFGLSVASLYVWFKGRREKAAQSQS